MTAQLERRALQIGELRVVDGGEDERTRIEGHAAIFGVESKDLGGFREVIEPGAFEATIQGADVRGLQNHNPNRVLGRTRAGTLTLTEDARGLAFVMWPPESQWASDLLISMRRGDVDQMSFGFEAVRDRWTTDDRGVLRSLLEVNLFDISVVTFPAYPETTAEVRNRAIEFSTGGDGPGGPATGEHETESEPGARRSLANARLELARRSK